MCSRIQRLCTHILRTRIKFLSVFFLLVFGSKNVVLKVFDVFWEITRSRLTESQRVRKRDRLLVLRKLRRSTLLTCLGCCHWHTLCVVAWATELTFTNGLTAKQVPEFLFNWAVLVPCPFTGPPNKRNGNLATSWISCRLAVHISAVLTEQDQETTWCERYALIRSNTDWASISFLSLSGPSHVFVSMREADIVDELPLRGDLRVRHTPSSCASRPQCVDQVIFPELAL